MNYNIKPIHCDCGEEAETDYYVDGNHFVYCKKCKITTTMYDTEIEVIEAWNKVMTGNEDYATIEGAGDLHYCGYCKGDLSNAWIENYDYCPTCKKVFKDKNYEP